MQLYSSSKYDIYSDVGGLDLKSLKTSVDILLVVSTNTKDI